jgi:hypothetical protein
MTQFGFLSHQIYLGPITPCQLAWHIKMKFPKTTQVLRLFPLQERMQKKKEGIKDMQALKATFCTLLLIRNS